MRLANAVLGQDAAIGAEPMLYAATADVDGGAYIEPGGDEHARAPDRGSVERRLLRPR